VIFSKNPNGIGKTRGEKERGVSEYLLNSIRKSVRGRRFLKKEGGVSEGREEESQTKVAPPHLRGRNRALITIEKRGGVYVAKKSNGGT